MNQTPEHQQDVVIPDVKIINGKLVWACDVPVELLDVMQSFLNRGRATSCDDDQLLDYVRTVLRELVKRGCIYPAPLEAKEDPELEDTYTNLRVAITELQDLAKRAGVSILTAMQGENTSKNSHTKWLGKDRGIGFRCLLCEHLPDVPKLQQRTPKSDLFS